MTRTLHVRKRMTQRGIKSQYLNLIRDFGTDLGNERVVLDKKAALAAVACLNKIKHDLMGIIKAQGYVLVEADGQAITSYRLTI